jgi:hypothetical protein
MNKSLRKEKIENIAARTVTPTNCRVALKDFEPLVQGGPPLLPLGFSLIFRNIAHQ